MKYNNSFDTFVTSINTYIVEKICLRTISGRCRCECDKCSFIEEQIITESKE